MKLSICWEASCGLKVTYC